VDVRRRPDGVHNVRVRPGYHPLGDRDHGAESARTNLEGGAWVTWQEALRKLDEELASGNLSADEYRARRDQVLSSAVTTGNQQPPQVQGNAGGSASETQIIEPVSPPQGVQAPGPQAAPQQGQGQQPPRSNPEATQVVSPADPGAERTQVVSPWQTHSPHPASPAGGFPQPQQASPSGGFPQPQQTGPGSPAQGFAQPQQRPEQPWNAAQEDVSPPWSGGDFGPIVSPRDADWVAQGPETFETTPSSGKGRKIGFAALGIVLVAGLGLAIWLLFIRDDGSSTSSTAAASQTQQAPPTKSLPEPPPTKPEPASTASTLIDPPGTQRNGGGEFDLAGLQSSKLLPPTVTDALAQAGMTEALLRTTTNGSSTIGLYALTMLDPAKASTVAQEYANVQQEGGLPANRDLSFKGVPVFSTKSGAAQSVFRAVYVVYSRVVIVETFGADRAAVQQQFQDILTLQLEQAPPTQRAS
jgi:hypothetical protein